ncbi:serine/threonine protein kinase, partial [Streptomyces sp. GC420]|nr:serine/threonine protein kinase [Streptomyces sp. GC420]
NETGYLWVPPDGWRRDERTPSKVHYHAPDGRQELGGFYALESGADLFTQWRNWERESHDQEGYRRIRLERTTFRGREAVVWEYHFRKDGVAWRARQTGFNAGGKSYQLNIWYRPEVRSAALRTYEAVSKSFTPL